MKKKSQSRPEARSKTNWLLPALALLGLPLCGWADDVEYAITDDNQLGTIDFQTGVFTQLGTGQIVSGGYIGDMARLPGGLVYLTPVNGTLALVNPATLQTSTIGPTQMLSLCEGKWAEAEMSRIAVRSARPYIARAWQHLATAAPRPRPDFPTPPLGALPCGTAFNFFKESEGRWLNSAKKALKLGVASIVESGFEGNKVAEVKSGSVTLSIFKSHNTLKVPKKLADDAPPGASPEFEIKHYDSFIIPYYEGTYARKVLHPSLTSTSAIMRG